GGRWRRHSWCLLLVEATGRRHVSQWSAIVCADSCTAAEGRGTAESAALPVSRRRGPRVMLFRALPRVATRWLGRYAFKKCYARPLLCARSVMHGDQNAAVPAVKTRGPASCGAECHAPT